MLRIHAALVEVNGGVSAAGTRKVMNEVKAPQTGAAVPTVEFPCGPLSLQTRAEDHCHASEYDTKVTKTVRLDNQVVSVSRPTPHPQQEEDTQILWVYISCVRLNHQEIKSFRS